MPQRYQEWDEGLVRYDMYPAHGELFRGPPPRPGRRCIAFIGAAQTFGRYSTHPFPTLVGRDLGVEVLNLGVGGKGPAFFRQCASLMEAVNRCSLVVVQVMSGRSLSNSVFAVEHGGCNGTGAGSAAIEPAERFYRDFINTHDASDVAAVVSETRRRYAAEMSALLRAISAPKILFWFSVRRPEKTAPDPWSAHGLLDTGKRLGARCGLLSRFELMCGCFPHFIDRSTLLGLVPEVGRYVECVSTGHLPQLVQKGMRLRWNNYYPSDGMHRAAAASLLPACRELLA